MRKRILTALVIVLLCAGAAMAMDARDILFFYSNGLKYTGINMLGATQSWDVPQCDVYVDSVAGDDSNPGTIDEPLQTIAALEAIGITEGMKIGLKAGSYWREQLDITASNVEVYGYGSGPRPTLDASDIVDNEDFALEGGYSNVYAVSAFGSAASPTETFLGVWENGVALNYVSSLATCESTPGTFYVVDANTFPKPVYVHATDSSNVTTNGKTYEISERYWGIYAASTYDGIKVSNVKTTKNLHGGGSTILYGKNISITNSIFEDGNKHNVLIGSGEVVGSVAWKNDISARTNKALFIGYLSQGNGESILFDECAAKLSTGSPAGTDPFYAHSSSDSYPFDSIAFTDISWNIGTVAAGNTLLMSVSRAKNIQTAAYTNSVSISFDSAIGNLDITDTYINGVSAGAGYKGVVAYGQVNTISGLRTLHQASISTGGMVWYKNATTIDNSVFYRIGTTTWANGPTAKAAGATLAVSESIFYGFDRSVDAGAYTSSGDNNVFYPSTTDYQVGGVNYTSISAYKTAVAPVDANSITSDPLFTAPTTGDFSLQAGSPAIGIGAGLTNPNVQYTPIPSDEILAQW